jgi:hypothetical protein
MGGRRSWLLRARREARGLSGRTLLLQALLLCAATVVLLLILVTGRSSAPVPTVAIAVLGLGLLVAVLLEAFRRH